MNRKFYFQKESLHGAFYAWRFDYMGEKSELFIKKEWVPSPIPQSLQIHVYSNANVQSGKSSSAFGTDSLSVTVHPYSEHSTIYRYDSRGKNEPINSVYIPKSLLRGLEAEKNLQVVVEWDAMRLDRADTKQIDSELIQLKVSYLQQNVIRQDIELTEIYHEGDDLFRIEYLVSQEEYDRIDPDDCNQYYRVLDLDGDISGMRFAAYRTDL